MERDVKLTFVLHLLLALVAVVSMAMVVFQSNYAGLVTPVVVFLLPFLVLLLWLFRKFRGINYPIAWQRYITGFRIAIVTGWCMSLLPGLFWGAIFFHMYEPWPFSRNQGPDTSYAEAGLQKVLGFSTGDVISQVYYKGYDIRDDDRYLRFTSCDEEIKRQTIADLEKAPRGKKVPAFHLNSKLSWWFTESDTAGFEHWKSEFKEVWIDQRSCTFYVRSWTT